MRLSVWVVKFRFAWWKGFGSHVFLAANLAAMRRQAADQQSLVSVHDIQHNLQVFRSSLRVSSFSRYKSCMSWPPSSSVYKTLNYKKYNILSPSLYSFLSSTRFTYNSASTFDPLQSNDWIIGCREAASKGLVEIITLLAEEKYEALHLTLQCSTNILFRFFKDYPPCWDFRKFLPAVTALHWITLPMLTTGLHLERQLRMSGAKRLLHLYSLMAWTG